MIEKLVLALVTLDRRLRPYFHSHTTIVQIDHLIRQVLQKPELVGRMVTWLIELSEFSLKWSRSPKKTLGGLLCGWFVEFEGRRGRHHFGRTKLVAEHIKDTYQMKDSLLLKNYHKVLNMLQKFEKSEVKHIPRENNT
ncbi:hypothetical protein CR513_03538, partial [Mucuna pruriens]